MIGKLVIGFLLVSIIGISIYYIASTLQDDVSGAPPYGVSENEADNVPLDPMALYRNWKRPEGPPKVGLQVGHWNSKELPEELANIRGNTGSSGGGKWEWEVNYDIAQKTSELLKKDGVEVDIIPATVPPKYFADIFIAIHADGSTDKTKSGYKFASPWRDLSGKSDELVLLLEEDYEKFTKLQKDPNITRNMRGYYAFSWWRYEHAIHPMTTAVIAETGFLTSPSDQRLLINNSDVIALSLYTSVKRFLQNQKLL